MEINEKVEQQLGREIKEEEEEAQWKIKILGRKGREKGVWQKEKKGKIRKEESEERREEEIYRIKKKDRKRNKRLRQEKNIKRINRKDEEMENIYTKKWK